MLFKKLNIHHEGHEEYKEKQGKVIIRFFYSCTSQNDLQSSLGKIREIRSSLNGPR
jgi:hypothetical protein